MLALGAPASPASHPYRAFELTRNDGALWRIMAVSRGGTIAGTYARPATGATMAGQNGTGGAFTWNGRALALYPAVSFPPHTDRQLSISIDAVNDRAVAVGSVTGALGDTPVSFATRYAHGTTTWLTAAPAATVASDMTNLPYNGANVATDVNASGTIVGGFADGRGFVVTPEGNIELPDVLAPGTSPNEVFFSAVDDAGDIVGTASTVRPFGNSLHGGGVHAFVMRYGKPGRPVTDLNAVLKCPDSYANAISTPEAIDGQCGLGEYQPWQLRAGSLKKLGTINTDGSPHNMSDQNPLDLPGAADGVRKPSGFVPRLPDGTAFKTAGDLGALVDPASGWTFTSVTGSTAKGWVFGTGTHGGKDVPFVLVPEADSAAAAAYARLPATPAFSSAAPRPAARLVATGPPARAITRLVTSFVRVTKPSGPVAALPVRWTNALPELGPDILGRTSLSTFAVGDNGDVFVSQAGSIAAFDGEQRAKWTAPFAGTPRLMVAGRTLVADDPAHLVALDVATGTQRWAADEEKMAVQKLPLIAAGATTIAVDDPDPEDPNSQWEHALAVYSLADGAKISTSMGFGCAAIFAVGGGVQCRTTSGPELDAYPVPSPPDATAIWSFSGFDAIGGDADDLYGISAHSFVAIHPKRETYDLLTFPIAPDAGRTFAYDETYVYVASGGNLYRYRRDRDPQTQSVTGIRLGYTGQPPAFFAAYGALYFRSSALGFVTIRYDAAGKPTAFVNAAYARDAYRSFYIAGHDVFLPTAQGVDVLDLRTGGVLGTARMPCSDVQPGRIVGTTAVIGCLVHASGPAPAQLKTLYGIALPAP